MPLPNARCPLAKRGKKEMHIDGEVQYVPPRKCCNQQSGEILFIGWCLTSRLPANCLPHAVLCSAPHKDVTCRVFRYAESLRPKVASDQVAQCLIENPPSAKLRIITFHDSHWR